MACSQLFNSLKAGTVSVESLTPGQISSMWPCLGNSDRQLLLIMVHAAAP
jgi:hypothetical protein